MKRIVIAFLLSLCEARHLLLKILPSKTVLTLASSIGGLAGFFCAREKAVSVAQLQYAFPEGVPNQLPLQIESLVPKDLERASGAGNDPKSDNHQALSAVAKRVFSHVGRGAGELLVLEGYLRSQKGASCDKSNVAGPLEIVSIGDEIIDNLLSTGQGAIGLSAHLGSFELLAAYLARRGLKCSVIGRSPNYPALEKLIRKFRLTYGVEVIWSDAADAPRQLVNAVRGGRIICALVDQDTKWTSGFSSFFGLEAASPIAPIQMALRYRLPLFSSFIVRTGRMSHQITTEVIPYNSDDPAAIKTILNTYNQRLEQLIRLYPDQYIWWHRRWRRRPGVDYGQFPQLLRNTRLYKDWLSTVATSNVASAIGE